MQYGIEAGIPVDRFVPRMSFFFNAHNDFFEEIAKYRAARKLWAAVMRDRFGATDERAWKLRFHAQTAGVSLTAQQLNNNIVRTALQALAAVLGGTNSLHTNSLDEALALPSREAAMLALRTQQVIAYESGVPSVVDPFGGSYFVERLTRDLETGARGYVETIDAMGGMVAAIEQGYPQQEIANSAYRFQRSVERGEKSIVGVNEHVDESRAGIDTLYIDEATAERQVDRLRTQRGSAMAIESPGRSTHCDTRRRHEQSHAACAGGRARVRHPRRDVRCAPRRVGGVRGERGAVSGGARSSVLRLRS